MRQEKTVILEPSELLISLEKTQYEMDAHKDLLAWMLNNAFDITSASYQMYHAEYIDLFKKYHQLKKEFEQTIVSSYIETGKIASWFLDYNTNSLTMTYDD